MDGMSHNKVTVQLDMSDLYQISAWSNLGDMPVCPPSALDLSCHLVKLKE